MALAGLACWFACAGRLCDSRCAAQEVSGPAQVRGYRDGPVWPIRQGVTLYTFRPDDDAAQVRCTDTSYTI